MNKIAPFLFFLALTLNLAINISYAQDEDINIVNLPSQLATHWGISVEAAGIFLSSLLFFAFLFPFMLWRKSGLMVIIVGFAIMGFCISIGWLPYWLMLIVSLLIASLWASKIKGVF